MPEESDETADTAVNDLCDKYGDALKSYIAFVVRLQHYGIDNLETADPMMIQEFAGWCEGQFPFWKHELAMYHKIDITMKQIG